MDCSEMPVRVEVKVTLQGDKPNSEDSLIGLKKAKRWVIMDTDESVSKLARYRTDHPLTAYNAWTSSVYLARWFMTKRKAEIALLKMWKDRLILAERAARRAEIIRPDNPAAA